MALYDLIAASLITIFAYFLIFVPGYISEMCDEKLFLIFLDFYHYRIKCHSGGSFVRHTNY